MHLSYLTEYQVGNNPFDKFVVGYYSILKSVEIVQVLKGESPLDLLREDIMQYVFETEGTTSLARMNGK